MRNVRFRIAALVGGSVLLTLLLIMGAFNLIVRHRMKQNADSALDSFTAEDEQYSSQLYSPEIIFIEEDTQDHFPPQLYTAKERALIAWCKTHDAESMQMAEIGGNTYYLKKLPSDSMKDTITFGTEEDAFDTWLSDIPEEEDGEFIKEAFSHEISVFPNETLIAYVDITGELNMIRQINLVFLIAAFLIGAGGSTMGYLIGRRLEQNELAQKRFFENTSHELKTPLTSILGYAEGIETGVITDYRKTGRVIAAQTEKISSLVEEILCAAKLESGAVTLEREPVGIPEFIQDCLMPFEGNVRTKALAVSLALEPMTVSADPDKLGHAVSNLLVNALKYAKTEIRISCGGGVIRIENDTDPLPDEALRHLFDRFYTGPNGNTGIGLSIAREIVRLHGWNLTAERTETGICFLIRCA